MPEHDDDVELADNMTDEDYALTYERGCGACSPVPQDVIDEALARLEAADNA